MTEEPQRRRRERDPNLDHISILPCLALFVHHQYKLNHGLKKVD
jgi:hypothetical protein